MALVKCDECRTEVSDNAEFCPNCGEPDPGHWERISRIQKRNEPVKKSPPGFIAFMVSLIIGYIEALFVVGVLELTPYGKWVMIITIFFFCVNMYNQ